MKTIVEKNTNISKYIFDDSVNIIMLDDKTVTSVLIISDLTISNAVVVENVTPPEDWTCDKYLYIDGNWELNQNWEPPNALK